MYKYKKVILLTYIAFFIALIFGSCFKVIVYAEEQNTTTEENTISDKINGILTDDEKEAIDKANHLTDDEHDAILNASKKVLEELELDNVPSSTNENDLDFDMAYYLSSSEPIFDNQNTVIEILDAIYRMVLSIRNVCIVILGALICSWVHKNLSKIIARFSGKGRY